MHLGSQISHPADRKKKKEGYLSIRFFLLTPVLRGKKKIRGVFLFGYPQLCQPLRIRASSSEAEKKRFTGGSGSYASFFFFSFYTHNVQHVGQYLLSLFSSSLIFFFILLLLFYSEAAWAFQGYAPRFVLVWDSFFWWMRGNALTFAFLIESRKYRIFFFTPSGTV